MATDSELLIKVKADTDRATKEIGRLTKELGKMSKVTKSATSSSKNVSKVFNGINTSASKLSGTLKGLAAAYLSIEGAKSLVSTAADIEEGFLGVSKTTGLAGEEMDTFKQKLFDMSTELAGVSVGELQKIAETAGQLGIQGTDSILEFTRIISMMASTTELSAEQAASSMAQLGNSLKIPVSEYENLASSINELSNTTTASAGDIISYTQRIAGMSKTFGLSNTEILAFSSTLKDVGISAELGGTAINTMMMQMLQNTEGFAKVAGKSLQEYSNIIKTEPVQAVELFLQALDKMNKNTKIETLDALKLSSSGALQTMLKLSGATDLLTTSINTSTTAWENNISIQNEYNTFSEGLNAQMERAKNAITVLASEIGNALLPKLKELIDTFVLWVQSLDDAAIAKFSADIASLAGGFADIITTIGGFIVSIGSIAAESPKITVAILGTVAALKTLNGAMLLFGARTVASGASMAPFVASSVSMTSAIGSMWKALNVVIMAAGPWGIALAGMAAATYGLVTVSDNYTKSLRDAANADVDSANKMIDHTNAIEGIGVMYQQADQEAAKYGNTTKATHDKIEGALQSEIKAIEEQLTAWNKTGEMTKTQESNFFALAETVGTLKAKLDTLDADYTINVALETSQADSAYNALEEKIKKQLDVDLKINSNVKEVEKEKEKLVKDSSSEHKITSNVDKVLKDENKLSKPTDSKHTIKDNIRQVERDKSKLKTPTSSVHTIKDNASQVMSKVRSLNGGTTHSTHIIDVYENKHYAGGGPLPQHLAVGGRFTGSGRVPGYDPTDGDRVNAKLTGGEYVIKRRAVDAIGIATLNAINSFRFPKLPGFAEGGPVGGSTSTSPDARDLGSLGTLTLMVGGYPHKVLVPRDVAEALQKNLNSEGGLY